jgi:hypothetical protein
MGQHRTALQPSYETDFYAWTQHQAKLLRALSRLNSELPAGLDIERVAEEIQDLGSAELNSVKSLIRQILVHLIKSASEPDSNPGKHWRGEATSFHADLLDRYLPSMRQLIDMQTLWLRAMKVADAVLSEHGSSISTKIPAQCPFSVADLTQDDFRFDETVDRLRERLAAD